MGNEMRTLDELGYYLMAGAGGEGPAISEVGEPGRDAVGEVGTGAGELVESEEG